MEWSKSSWKNFDIKQQPPYKDQAKVNEVLERLSILPSLVSFGEIDRLKKRLVDAHKGKRFILQGGDCAERFIDCNSQSIANKIKILLQMGMIIHNKTGKPVVKIARIAGQYSKPRSSSTEVIDGVEYSSYRGDNVNSYEKNQILREPDPKRLMDGYFYSSATLNFIRALINGGFADMHNQESWILDFVKDEKKLKAYKDIINNIDRSISFLESFGGINEELIGKTSLYSSHEGLILGMEDAFTKLNASTGKWYNTSAHFLWIGERTRDLNGAHVEYFRGLENPIGVKVGPTMDEDELLTLIDKLNPTNEEGRLTLITRMGAENIMSKLPKLIKNVNKYGKNVLWSCDPMHANTKSVNGVKTREFDDILKEIKLTVTAHKENKSNMAGIHFELTGDNVTECVGGTSDISHSDLNTNYQTYVDPRLNYTQSLDISFLLAEML